MSARWQRVARLARLPAGLLLLVLVAATADVDEIARALGTANPWLVVPAVGGLVGMHLVPALAWRSMVRRLAGVELPARATVRDYYAAQALGGITPANIGGDLYRASLLRSAGRGWRASVAPIVLQRATSYLALSALSLASIAVIASSGAALPIVVVGVGTAALVGVTAFALIAPPPFLRRLVQRFAPAATAAAVDGTTLATDFRASNSRRAAAIGLLTGLAFHGGSVALTWVVLIGVDPSLGVPAVAASLAIARLSIAVPVSPSGLGVQEGALAALVGAAGGPVWAAVAGMLLARGALLATTGIGALIVATSTGPRGDVRDADPNTRSGVSGVDAV